MPSLHATWLLTSCCTGDYPVCATIATVCTLPISHQVQDVAYEVIGLIFSGSFHAQASSSHAQSLADTHVRWSAVTLRLNITATQMRPGEHCTQTTHNRGALVSFQLRRPSCSTKPEIIKQRYFQRLSCMINPQCAPSKVPEAM
jgi:hypothetical protein